MTRHIADEQRPHGEGRARQFTEIERRTRAEPGRVAKALHRQPSTRGEDTRTRRYAEIERTQD